MKRSKSLRLVLMGGAALSLGACDQPVEVGVFETVEQCQVMGYKQSACETAVADAKKEHLQAAPKFATRSDCEAEFGADRCESGTMAQKPGEPPAAQQPGGQQASSSMGSFFMPMMMGYMMGQMMGGGRYDAQPLYRPTGGQAGNTGLYTGSGTQVATRPGQVTMPKSTFETARAGNTTLQRGGFGARANTYSVAS